MIFKMKKLGIYNKNRAAAQKQLTIVLQLQTTLSLNFFPALQLFRSNILLQKFKTVTANEGRRHEIIYKVSFVCDAKKVKETLVNRKN